jgi:RNA 2',3'-cyclic 3'-phosphodiesterase
VRLFVAVELSEPVREDLDSRTGVLRGALEGWRWVRPEQWHLTLAFLGEVPDERLPELTRRMGLAARRHRPFDLWLDGFGAFRNPRRAQVLWARVAGDGDALAALADSVGAGARRARIELEQRRYRAHVTLGRRRTAVDLSETLDCLGTGTGDPGPAWRVEEFVLVQSHLGASVRHEVRERFPLGREAGR